MPYDPEKHNRQSIRLKGYDYSQPGFYYITMCTQDRIERFGTVSDDKMILNDAGEMMDAEWKRIPERSCHVIIDAYQIMPNHMHGILQIKPFENGIVGTGLVPVLKDGDESVENDPIDGDKTNANMSENDITVSGRMENDITVSGRMENDVTVSGRMGTRPIPTPLYDIIGTFKSLTQHDYAYHVRNNGWPPFRKRLWQLRFHDHIIRNRIEPYPEICN